MERPSRIQQVYGYAVCIVAIITTLIATSNIVEATFARLDPLRAAETRYGADGALSSFEAYQATSGPQVVQAGAPTKSAAAVPASADSAGVAEQRKRYEALRADRVDRMIFDSSVRLVEHGLLLLLSLGLFGWHYGHSDWRSSQRHGRWNCLVHQRK